MKNRAIALLAFIFITIQSSFAQYEVWQHQGYSIGVDATGGGIAAMGAMPDVVHIGSQYFMYYVAKYGAANAFYYATSPDMINWTVQDTIMTASLDTNNRIYDLGGPGILKLDNGQYRLFYRTAQKSTPPNEPLFHIRSMISSDGIHFTHEAGVRVENQTYQSNSYFKSASHPSVYKDINGNTKAIITGRDTTMNINSPAGLYTASSTDEGLTWNNFSPLYAKCHDPIVIRDSNDLYHMYTTYLGESHREATSTDGIFWPSTADSMIIKQGSTILNEQSSIHIIADLGAAVKANGEIVLYSNYKPLGPGAWIDIAYYSPDITSGVENANENINCIVYPNPSTDFFMISQSTDQILFLKIYSGLGEMVYEGSIKNGDRIEIDSWVNGMYYFSISRNNIVLKNGNLMVVK